MSTQEQNNTTTTARSGPPLRIGDLLLEKGLVTDQQIEQALAKQRTDTNRKLLGEVLVDMGFVTDHQVMEVVADAYDVPFAMLTSRLADAALIEKLPRDFLEEHVVLPLFLVEDKLTIALPEPSNVFLIEEIERMTGHPVQVVVATATDIKSTTQSLLPDTNVFVIDDLVDDLQDADLSVVDSRVTDLSDMESSANESPVIKLVNFVIFSAIKERASDIHIEPDDGTVRVRNRVDGRLYTAMSPPAQMLPAIVSRIKIMAKLDISERRMPQDGAITIMIDGRQIDLRVSTMPGKFGEKVVIRVIDTRNAMVQLDKLGFSQSMGDRFRELVHRPNGIVLVTGPTGSGKSTTLYAALQEINDETINISTVEDPVEFNVPGINQFQVNKKAGFVFATALKTLLRQDPDVIMVGEIRDPETAKIAIQAALTGHMVFSTLHTNDAVSAVTRLVNIGVESYLVAASLRGVLAQRLVRKVCAFCKDQIDIDAQSQRILDRMAEHTPRAKQIDKLFAGSGCARCRQGGYAGRIGIYELLVPDDEALDKVSQGISLQELRKHAIASGGYTTLLDDGLDKVAEGLTTLEELVTTTTA